MGFLDGKRALITGICLLYTSDAADERSSVDLGGRRIIKKKNKAGSAARDRSHEYNAHATGIHRCSDYI